MASEKRRKEGKNRSGSETRKRGPIIGFRATEDERARIQAAADRAGLTVGSYVRSRCLEKPTTRAVRRAPMQTAQLAQMLGLIGLVGGELQRIANRLDDREAAAVAEVTAGVADFRAAAAAIMRLMGKRTNDH